jgi:malate dehydrogenase
MRLAQMGAGDIFLIDIAKGIAEGKALDLEDARLIARLNYNIKGTEDLTAISNSDIIVVTAGFARKPGMTREDLLNKNAQILKEVCHLIKTNSPNSIVIMVTNPLDLMTRYALKATGFSAKRLFGMGLTLDCSRFANLIAKELGVSVLDVEATVIGSHGEGMLPLLRLSKVKGVKLDELLTQAKADELMKRTFERGKEILSLLGSGSAYFAPSAAIADIVRIILKDEKRTVGLSAYLDGEYGISGICIGVPCRLGKNGIEDIIELDLNKTEKDALLQTAVSLKEQFSKIILQ